MTLKAIATPAADGLAEEARWANCKPSPLSDISASNCRFVYRQLLVSVDGWAARVGRSRTMSPSEKAMTLAHYEQHKKALRVALHLLERRVAEEPR